MASGQSKGLRGVSVLGLGEVIAPEWRQVIKSRLAERTESG